MMRGFRFNPYLPTEQYLFNIEIPIVLKHENKINVYIWSPHKIRLTTAPHAPLLTLPTQHTTATHPAPSPSHYHTPPATQYLTTHQTTVPPLYPNPPPLHAIPYTTSPSSTATQSLHPPQTSTLAPQTHCPTFPRIVIPHQSHTPRLDTHGWVPEKDTKGHNCEWP